MITQKNMILDINKLKEQLDNAEIYEDENGNKIQTVYLGDIRDITPSGKVYMPFACSNLELCTRCNGTGTIKNKHGKRKKHEKVCNKRTHILRTYKWTQHNENKEEKLWKQESNWEPMKLCPECDGIGSLEARLDEDWWNQLEIELDEIGAWSHISEDDGCDIMISRNAPGVNEYDNE